MSPHEAELRELLILARRVLFRLQAKPGKNEIDLKLAQQLRHEIEETERALGKSLERKSRYHRDV